MNILVVDDHHENVLALRAILSRPEYRIVEARSGSDALKALLKHEFAVVLLDVLMPRMDGFETARLMRQREATRHIPVVFLTANATDLNLIYRGYSVGAVDYLIKPIDPDIVKAKVTVFVDLYRKTQQIRRQEEQMRLQDRQRSDQKLQESEAQYEAAFHEAPVAIAHISPEGEYLRVNPRFCEILGYSAEELCRMTLEDVTLPEDLPRLRHQYERLLAEEAPTVRCEERARMKNGRAVWLNRTASAVKSADGEIEHLVVVMEDVSEQRMARERQKCLAEASELLLSSLDYKTVLVDVARLLVQSVADWCIIDVHGDGTLSKETIVAHKKAELEPYVLALANFRQHESGNAITSVTRTGIPALWADRAFELFEDGPAEVLDASSRCGLESATAAALRAGERTLGVLVLGCGPESRQYRPGDMEMVADLAHRIAFALENARLLHTTKQAVSARDEFLSIASHELRTPLTALTLLMQRLQLMSAKQGPPEQNNMLLRSGRQVQRLTALVENLLDVSRLASGRLTLDRESLDLVALSKDVANKLREEASQAHCALHIDAREPVEGAWDRLRIEQVLTNLLTNAIKYGAGKPIDIQVTREAGIGVFRIRDQGIGIDDQRLPHIFERFERAVSSRDYGGLGLGLYIARQIVDAHGGDIRVLSRPGRGSIFAVALPAVAEQRHVVVKADPHWNQGAMA